MVRVSLVVDARSLSGSLFQDDSVSRFLEQWAVLEPKLQGAVLRGGTTFPVHVDDGVIQFEVLSPLGEVTVDGKVEFGVVAVRERPVVRSVYRCAQCRRDGERAYGPFVCQRCPADDRRVCDQHAVVLPGSLESTCPAHAPTCPDCARPAVGWCPGPRCNSRVGWCDRHVARHPSDPATGYCHNCLAALFPACGQQACDGVGSVECDHLDASGRPCGARRCPRHARRWQVFGPHTEGLGRCDRHSNVVSLPADGVIYQILGACAYRRLRVPTLRSLRHVLMKGARQQCAITDVLRLALAAPRHSPALGKEIGKEVAARSAAWEKEARDFEDAVHERTHELVNWLRVTGNATAAAGLVGTGWVRPRNGNLGTLYVRCDARLFPRPRRDAASAALGFNVRLEKTT